MNRNAGNERTPLFMKYERPTGYITKCQICSSEGLETILDLGHHPMVQAYITESQLHDVETTYPLNLCRCRACGLVQLDYIADPATVFPPEYPYQTGMTNMLVRNFEQLAALLHQRLAFAADDLVIDIGSNDGTLLRAFRDKGAKVLGIEPTDVAKIANERGIETVQAYLTLDAAERILAAHGQAKVITATNVFAHINNLSEIMEAIRTLLADDGVFVSESQYLLDTVEKLEVDTIYHEHLRFYSLKPLQTLFERSGFTLVDAERISAAGGSIRVFAKKGRQPVSDRVQPLVDAEVAAGLYDPGVLRAFADRAIRAKHALTRLLVDCKEKGAIAGIGSPARSNTLLNFAKIDNHLIEYACERRGSSKIGLFTPGSHIPVVDEQKLLDDRPAYALILSWHIGDELAEKLKGLGYGGKFIIPLPEPRIIS
jgi:2-polyprenyl-3-methyl-5-hydroxy-6-metoxy-1,4-benzoquinol methylase